MEQLSKVIVATILLDVVLLGLLQLVHLPGDPRIYNFVAILVISPLLAYLIVFRVELGRSRDGDSESSS
ncbi:hypothetical protein [Haloarcula sp. JP-L23]|uniref:hypothetical protein n=1 Tax=Haloarcula sp. JP-L23 TaxID=2716717 RepID=UPI00140F2DA2|nr:hypothetical protein G9465_23245 [Haloarcula sp. JP-L23]